MAICCSGVFCCKAVKKINLESINQGHLIATKIRTMKKEFIAFVALLAMTACNNTSQSSEAQETSPTEQQDESSMTDESMEEEVKADYSAEVASIDQSRESIETAAESITPVEVSTNELREQIKQKWKKIHFYATDGKVIRVKTYPYNEISKRTEEFYFENGQLILAVIEDDGDGAMHGREKAEMSKMYYYKDGKQIYEVNNTSEEETSIRHSDGERLLQEAKEYLEIYETKK